MDRLARIGRINGCTLPFGLIVALLVTLLLAGCVSLNIPKQYQGQYGGELTIEYVEDANDLQFKCFNTPEWSGKWAQACAWPFVDNTCQIYIWKHASRPKVELLTHEIAHCKGWPANHSWAMKAAKKMAVKMIREGK